MAFLIHDSDWVFLLKDHHCSCNGYRWRSAASTCSVTSALKSLGPWMAWKLAIKRTKYGREMYRHISYLWRLFRSSISRAINSRQQTVPLVTAKSIFDPRSSWTYLLVSCGHIFQHVTLIFVKLIKIISMAMVSRCWLMEAGGGSTAGLSAAQFKQ